MLFAASCTPPHPSPGLLTSTHSRFAPDRYYFANVTTPIIFTNTSGRLLINLQCGQQHSTLQKTTNVRTHCLPASDYYCHNNGNDPPALRAVAFVHTAFSLYYPSALQLPCPAESLKDSPSAAPDTVDLNINSRFLCYLLSKPICVQPCLHIPELGTTAPWIPRTKPRRKGPVPLPGLTL